MLITAREVKDRLDYILVLHGPQESCVRVWTRCAWAVPWVGKEEPMARKGLAPSDMDEIWVGIGSGKGTRTTP